MSSSLGFSLSSITGPLVKILLSFVSSIESDFSLLLSQTFGGLGNSVVLMFQTFGSSLGPYKVLAPVVFVGALGLSIVVGFFEFTVIDAEKDVTGFENDV